MTMKLKAKKPVTLKIPSVEETTAPASRSNRKKTFDDTDDNEIETTTATANKSDNNKNNKKISKKSLYNVKKEEDNDDDDENAPEIINAADASLEQLRQLHQIINVPKKKRKVIKKENEIDISKPIDFDDSIFAVVNDSKEVTAETINTSNMTRKVIKPKTHKKM